MNLTCFGFFFVFPEIHLESLSKWISDLMTPDSIIRLVKSDYQKTTNPIMLLLQTNQPQSDVLVFNVN